MATLTDQDKQSIRAAGADEASVLAELTKFSGLNIDAAIGNVLSRKPSLTSVAPSTNQASEVVPGIGTVTRIPKTLTAPAPAPQDTTAGLMARSGIPSAPPPPPSLMTAQAPKATLINPATGDKKAVVVNSPEAQALFAHGYFLMGADGKPVAQAGAAAAPPAGAATTGQKQFYRIGADIYDAATNRKLGLAEWNQDWTGRATEVKAPEAAGGTGAGTSGNVPGFGGVFADEGKGMEKRLIDIWGAYTKTIEDIEKKMAEGYTPSAEEKALQAEYQKAKEDLAKFDLDTLRKLEGYVGAGTGRTLANVSLQQDKERRLAALDRLGLAQELSAYAERLSSAQDQRKTALDYAKSLFDTSAKKLDLALGITKEMNELQRQKKDDARAYLLDMINFSQGKAFEDLDPATQKAVMESVANSPLSLGMVKTALANAKTLWNEQRTEAAQKKAPNVEVLYEDEYGRKVYGYWDAEKKKFVSTAGASAGGGFNGFSGFGEGGTGAGGKVGGDPAFEQAARDAAYNATIGLTNDKSAAFRMKIDKLLKEGKYDEVRDEIATVAPNGLDAASRSAAAGRFTAIKKLDQLKKDMAAYQEAGGDMGLLTGTGEDIAAKLGTVTDPKLRTMAVKMRESLLTYIAFISGKTVSDKERQQYEGLFPAIGKTVELNNALIDGLLQTMDQNNVAQLEFILGTGNYDVLFKREIMSPLVAAEKQKEAEGLMAELNLNVQDLPPDVVTIDDALNYLKERKNFVAKSFGQGGDTALNPTAAEARSIALAIRDRESGGNYQARGGSGEFGAYQFMPATWNAWLKKYAPAAGNVPLDQAPQKLQDFVAVRRIQDLLNKGYTVRQIALIWNGGEPIAKKGVNRFGVNYDSGAYADGVVSVYERNKGKK